VKAIASSEQYYYLYADIEATVDSSYQHVDCVLVGMGHHRVLSAKVNLFMITTGQCHHQDHLTTLLQYVHAPDSCDIWAPLFGCRRLGVGRFGAVLL